MGKLLETCLHWIGKYVRSNDDVKKLHDGEWLEFIVYVQKKDENTTLFSNPILKTIIYNFNDGNEKIQVYRNEFKHD